MTAYDSDPSSLRSPQGRLMDDLLWNRMSKFWRRDLPEEQREALNAMYEGSLKVLDVEAIRLSEINDAKSLLTCPIFTQRRWVRLDLNRYEEVKGFLRFLVCGNPFDNSCCNQPTPESPDDENGAFLQCTQSAENRAAHWHISFPRVLPDEPVDDRRSIDLGYPVTPELTEVYRMVNVFGHKSGQRLLPGRDYEVLADGTTLRLKEGEVGDEYEFQVGLDFSDRERYEELNPRVFASRQFPGINAIAVPPEMSTGLPVHVLIVRGGPPAGGAFIEQTNSGTIDAEFEFIPYTGDPATGAAHNNQGIIGVPVALASTDIAFVFGTSRVSPDTPFNTLHSHDAAHFFVAEVGAVTPGSAAIIPSAGPVSEIPLTTVVVPTGIFGSVDYLGHGFHVFLDGRKLSRDEFNYVQAENKIYLKTPVSYDGRGYFRVDLLYTRETVLDPGRSTDLHNHVQCWQEIAQPVYDFATFDDGGLLDADPEETEGTPSTNPMYVGNSGLFDDSGKRSYVFLTEDDVDLDTLNVYVAGIYKLKGADYQANLEPSGNGTRVRIVFAEDISGKSILVTFRRPGSIVVYGTDDILGSNGACAEAMRGNEELLSDPATALDAFEKLWGQPLINPEGLIEAARIAIGGGNILFALFYDEKPEYSGINTDADGQYLSGDVARAVESVNTQLISIPFLVDYPYRPTVRFEEGTDYRVVEGALFAGTPLTEPRGPEDEQPGVWWCPVLMLDEHLLSKNFGAIVGDRRDSSLEYRNALTANFLLRFAGPVIQQIQWSAAVLLGSPMFTQDGRITSVRQITTARLVTVDGDGVEETFSLPPSSTPPAVGTEVFAGQSLVSPLVINTRLQALISWNGSLLNVKGAWPRVDKGDIVQVQLYDAKEDEYTWATFFAVGFDRKALPDGSEATQIAVNPRTDKAVTRDSIIRIVRDAGPPFVSFRGTISDVSEQRQWQIETDGGERFLLPPDVWPEYAPRDPVRRGQPVQPGKAVYYDRDVRPNWQYITPDQERSYWEFLSLGDRINRAPPTTDVRFCSLEPGTGGYGRIFLAHDAYPLERGDRLVFTEDNTGLVSNFTVVGPIASAEYWVSPNVGGNKSGKVQVLRGVEPRSASRASSYYELPPPVPRPETNLRFNHPAGSVSLQVVNSGAFPDAGRAVLIHPLGGAITVEYFSKSEGYLLDVVWEDDIHPLLTGPDGTVSSVISPEWTLRLIATYEPRRLNPAFEALLQLRVESDLTPIDVEEAADELYELLSPSSAVLEAAAVSGPTALVEALYDTLPPGSTLVTLNRLDLVDIVTGKATDGTYSA